MEITRAWAVSARPIIAHFHALVNGQIAQKNEGDFSPPNFYTS